MMKWFYLQHKTEVGPVTETAMRELAAAGVISSETLVRREDRSESLPFATALETRPQPPQQQTHDTLDFQCPHCQASVSANASYTGLSTSCPSCGGSFVIPHSGGAGAGMPNKTRKPAWIKWAALGAIGLFLIITTIAALSIRTAHRQTVAAKLVEEAHQIAFKATGNRNWNKAVALLEEAAELNSHEAEYLLGTCHLFGRGVPQDSSEAAKQFRRSADGGYAEAQFNLSVCYAKGDGVELSEEVMLKWLKMAADQELPLAAHGLGMLYLSGQAVPLDQEKGIELINQAASQGLIQAQYELSLCFELGNGVPKDPIQAHKWAIIATRSGLSGGEEAVRESQSKLSPEQVAAAEQMANEWRPIEGSP